MALYLKNEAWTHFDPKLFAQSVHSSVDTNAPAGLIFAGDSQYTIRTRSTTDLRRRQPLPG